MANRAQGIILVRNPRSVNPAKSVDMDVSFDGRPFIPFTAMPDDAAGSALYEGALNGDYGDISLAPGKDYYWTAGQWMEMAKPSVEEQSRIRRDELMQLAAARIAPLQDAHDLGMANSEEESALIAWKQYRVLLNRVDLSAPVWPEMP